jgi:uncharacterized protein
MQLQRFDDPQEFYARAEAFLLAHEAENNLPLGIAATIMEDPTRYGDEFPYMVTVEKDGEVVLAALRTPPYSLVLPFMTDHFDAIKLVAEDVHQKYGDNLPGVNGPNDNAKIFADHWQQFTGKSYKIDMAQRIFRLDNVIPVKGVSGKLRRPLEADRPVVVEWIKQFQMDALGKELETEKAEAVFDRLINYTNENGLHVWQDDGKAVSIAGSARPTANGISIGLVYTPPEFRRKGYASACVAALSQLMLDSGRQFCFLYTDLSNPTSNHIYQQIGYRAVCDADAYVFS